MESFLILLGGASGILILMILSPLINGWALHLLWGWFVAPLFSLPGLTIGQAIGLSAVVSFMTYQYHVEPKEKAEQGLAAILGFLLRPIFYVVFGWFVKQFVGF